MTTPAFTARNVAKFVVKSIVAANVAKQTAQTIEDHTRYEKDDTVIEIGSHVVGWYVSEKLSPVTDKIVDKTADFVTEQRIKRQAKNNTEKSES